MSAEVSERESEVWALLGTPMTYNEIGTRLFISPRTVESHVESLRRKLGASSRRELARMWIDGEGQPELPAEISSFVGRQHEIAVTVETLDQSRLVTLTGPGGVGKTRLAVQVTRAWVEATHGRAVFVDLVPLPRAADVSPAVAAACHATATGAADVAIAARLSEGSALLVLDNAEHVLDSTARLVESLLMRCPHLRILVTSRVRLVLPFERVIVVGGLGEGPDGSAVQLLRERAGLPTLDAGRGVEICIALGGMPLAIELAAARLGTLGLTGLEASLSRQLEALRGGRRADARHRSLQETIAWSYNLLPPPEQRLLQRLWVFAESFTADSAGEVLGDDVGLGIAILCEHNLVRFDGADREERYGMLEAVREFGRQRLDAAQQAELAGRHARWALRAGSPAERLSAAERCAGPGADRALGHRLWLSLARSYFEVGRLRDAQACHERDAALSEGRDRASALTAAAALARCRVLGEDATRLDLQAADTLIEAGARAAAAEALARTADHAMRFAGMFADPPKRPEIEAMLARAQRLGGSDALANAALHVARARLGSAVSRDAIARARDALDRVQGTENTVWIGGALDALSVVLVEAGQMNEAAEVSLRRPELVKRSDDPREALELKDALHTGVLILTGAGRLEDARRLAERHLALSWLRSEPDLASEDLFAPAALGGDWGVALEHCEEYLAAWQRAGCPVKPGRAIAPAAISLIYSLRGQDGAAAEWHDVADKMHGPIAGDSYRSVFEAIRLLDRGDPARALAALATSGSGFLSRLFDAWARALRFEASVLAHVPAEAPVIDTNPIAALIVVRATALRDNEREIARATAERFTRFGCPYQATRTLAVARSEIGSGASAH